MPLCTKQLRQVLGQRGIGIRSPVQNTWTSSRIKGEAGKDESSIIHIDKNAFDPSVGSLGGGSTNLMLGDLRSPYCGLPHRELDLAGLLSQWPTAGGHFSG